MAINELLEAISGRIKDAVPGLREAKPHPGRFDATELKRVATRSPAVMSACLGLSVVGDPGTGERDVELVLASFVVSQGAADPAAVKAREIVEALVLLLAEERWGQANTMAPTRISADNLFGASGESGVALWAVSWRQVIRIGANVWAESENPLKQALVGRAPNIGTGHEGDYVLVTGSEEDPL
ncbi:MAG: hypothetical protein AB7E47_02820 [Desulfovibrionaceae bacterium]